MVCEQPKKIKLLICIKQQLLQVENKQGFSCTETQLRFLFGKDDVFETRHGPRFHLIWFFLMHRFQVNSIAPLPSPPWNKKRFPLCANRIKCRI